MTTQNLKAIENDIRLQGIKDAITHYTSGIAILQNKKILVVRRAQDDYLGGVYELPGGGIDEGESFAEGFIREAKEELGLDVTEIINLFPGFDYQTPKKPKARQINFLVTVNPGEIHLDPQEHDDYKWIEQREIDQLHASKEIQECLHEIFNAIKD